MNPQSKPFLGEGGEWILNAIKRNPEGLLLLAAGAVRARILRSLPGLFLSMPHIATRAVRLLKGRQR